MTRRKRRKRLRDYLIQRRAIRAELADMRYLADNEPLVFAKLYQNTAYGKLPPEERSSPSPGESKAFPPLIGGKPDCTHIIVSQWSGISCSLCGAWFCY